MGYPLFRDREDFNETFARYLNPDDTTAAIHKMMDEIADAICAIGAKHVSKELFDRQDIYAMLFNDGLMNAAFSYLESAKEERALA